MFKADEKVIVDIPEAERYAVLSPKNGSVGFVEAYECGMYLVSIVDFNGHNGKGIHNSNNCWWMLPHQMKKVEIKE